MQASDSPPATSHDCPASAAAVEKEDSNLITHLLLNHVFSRPILDSVKAAVITVLNSLIKRYIRDHCEGCEQNHPSQIRHPCLYPAPKNFFYNHHEELMTDFWGFFPTLEKLLKNQGMTIERQRLQGIIEGFLYDFCEVEDIDAAIQQNLERLGFFHDANTPAIKIIWESTFHLQHVKGQCCEAPAPSTDSSQPAAPPPPPPSPAPPASAEDLDAAVAAAISKTTSAATFLGENKENITPPNPPRFDSNYSRKWGDLGLF